MKNQLNETKSYKHLTYEDRCDIAQFLTSGLPFKEIAARVKKHPTTISYEIKLHRSEHRSGFSKITDDICPKLLKPPYVCNGCKLKSNAGCRYVRMIYSPKVAHSEYKELLHDAREGIPLNKSMFYEQDRIITQGLKNGQHINHIISSNPDCGLTRSTVYRHFAKGYYSAANIDLPRKVKFKPRKSHAPQYVPKGIKAGRTYDDFLDFSKKMKLASYVQADTVIGREGGKVIMTIYFTAFDFMTGLLLDNKTASQAAHKFCELKNRIREAGYSIKDIMPVILTDNGGEFSNVFAFENDRNATKELSMFYCDPMAPWQKAGIEKNHTLFRDIVPKGCSFDDFSQDTVDLIFSHINNVKRMQFHGKSAYELFTFAYGTELAAILGISKIEPKEVCQSHLLLKKQK